MQRKRVLCDTLVTRNVVSETLGVSNLDSFERFLPDQLINLSGNDPDTADFFYRTSGKTVEIVGTMTFTSIPADFDVNAIVFPPSIPRIGAADYSVGFGYTVALSASDTQDLNAYPLPDVYTSYTGGGSGDGFRIVDFANPGGLFGAGIPYKVTFQLTYQTD